MILKNKNFLKRSKIQKMHLKNIYIYWYAISKHCLDQETRRIARKEFKTLTTFACGLVDFDIQNEYICCKENNEFLKEN